MARKKATESIPRLTAETGRSGLKVQGGTIMEEYDPDLRGIRGIRVYDEMRRSDPTVAPGLRLFEWIIARVGWRVEPMGTSSADREAAEWLATCMDDMSHTWSDFLNAVTTMLWAGWSWFEIVYKVRNGMDATPSSKYDDGKIGWRKLVLIGQDSLLDWKFDETGGLIGLNQSRSYTAGKDFVPYVTIPIEKSVLFRLDKEKGNPEGMSLLRPVYLPWYKKRQIEEIEAIGIERDLTGVLIIYLPIGATDTDKDKAIKLLEQYKADDMTGFVSPRHGLGDENCFKFEIINSPGSKSIDTDKIVHRYELQILRALLAQFLMLGGGERGSWALSRDQSATFDVAIGAIVQSIEETVNRFLVAPLFRLNSFNGLTAVPQIKAGRVAKKDIDKFSAAVSRLIQVGGITIDRPLEAFIREELELPALVEDTQITPQTVDKQVDVEKGAPKVSS